MALRKLSSVQALEEFTKAHIILSVQAQLNQIFVNFYLGKQPSTLNGPCLVLVNYNKYANVDSAH